MLIGRTGKLLVSDWLSALAALSGLLDGGILSGILQTQRLVVRLYGIGLQFR